MSTSDSFEQSPGVLVVVVGPSGAGKDTLIEAARRHFADDPRLRFPKRVITRRDQAGETHLAVTDKRFDELCAESAFFLHWAAHGTRYGIGFEILSDLGSGKLVTVNVSRGMIGLAQEKWPHVRVVNVWAPPEILRERLLARGREGSEALEERLERDVPLPGDGEVADIENSGSREAAAARFIALLEEYAG